MSGEPVRLLLSDTDLTSGTAPWTHPGWADARHELAVHEVLAQEVLRHGVRREGTCIGGVAGDGCLQGAGGELRAHGNVVLVEGLQDEARQDLAHAEARLAQPHVPPHNLRVAALLSQLRELPQQLAAKPACHQVPSSFMSKESRVPVHNQSMAAAGVDL